MVNDLESSARSVSFGVDAQVVRAHADLFRTRRGGVDRLVATAIRTHSYDCRRVIAAVLDPNLTLEALINQVRQSEVPRGSDVDTSAQALLGLARVFAQQSLLPTDRTDAIALYAAARELKPYAEWARVDLRTFAQLLLFTGDLDEDDRLLGRVARLERHFLLADAASRRAHVGSEEWLSHVNAALASVAIAPVALHSSSLVPFDGLSAAVTLSPVDGPLITVVMLAYRPGPEIYTAVRSILDQTWRNLELLVVDDGSGPEFSNVFTDVTKLDTRITLLRRSAHVGTTSACQVGLNSARGELVTFQEVSDWSHPERLARQAQPLLDDADVQHTSSRAVWCRDDLVFTRIGEATVAAHAASTMFRRSVLEKLGESSTYQGRVAGLVERLDNAMSGRGCTLKSPLAFVRSERSKHLLGATEDPGTELDVEANFDVVFAGDWRRFGGPQRSMIEEIRALQSTEMRIGIMQLEALRFATTRDEALCEAVRQLIDAGVVQFVSLHDPVTIDVLLIRYPPVLEFVPSIEPNVRASTVVIVANQVPVEIDGTDRRYTVADCDSHVRALFGSGPYWLPQGPLVRSSIEDEGAPVGLLPYDNPGIIDVDAWRTPRERLRGVRPVIGRVSRDAALKWPDDPQELLQIYPSTPEFDVRIMGGRRTVTTVLGSVPAEWLVYEINEVPTRIVLGQIDFFVYFHHPVLQEAFGRVILEALASGCVVILPHHFEAVFGDAALYCRPSEVQGLVRRYHSDPSLYRLQARRGQSIARSQNGHEHFRELVVNLAALPGIGIE